MWALLTNLVLSRKLILVKYLCFSTLSPQINSSVKLLSSKITYIYCNSTSILFMSSMKSD